MQVLIIYYTRSNNTRKLAKAIVKGVEQVNGAKILLKATDEVTKEDFIQSDAIIAGSPVYCGTMAAEMKEVFDKFVSTCKQIKNKIGAMENKIGAAFATSGDVSGGKETTIMSIIQVMLVYGMIVVGDPGHRYGVACAGVPDKKTLSNGAKLGKRVATLAMKLKS